jgi:molybdate transport system substrate-binding protein
MFIQKNTRKFFLAISVMACTFNITHPSQAQTVSTTANQTLASSPTVTLFAAGSLTGSLTEIANDFTQQTGVTVNTNFGPSGLLEQSLENGAKADVFASADTGNPLKLFQEGKSGPVETFTSNRLVAVVRPGLSVTPDNLLNELLNPQIKVGTSTPLSDPLGDYTEQVFQKADALEPGSLQTLDAKAERLVGGADSLPVPSGKNNVAYFLEDTKQADIFLAYYTSGLSALQAAPDLQLVPLPDNLAV